ncbi:cytosolic non-specific dipeptidase-like [Haemaphysalis longicornis]
MSQPDRASGFIRGKSTPASEGIPKELEEVFKIIDNSREQMVSWLKTLVAIPSVSAEKHHRNDVIRVAEEAKAMLQEQGVLVSLEGLGNQQMPDGTTLPLPPLLLGTTARVPDRKTLCVYGHLDVHPACRGDGWTSDPFIPTERDGQVFARGTASDKGPLVAWLAAVRAFHLSAAKVTPVNLKFLIESMQTVGSQGLGSYLSERRHSDFFRGIDFACISDVAWLSPRKPCIVYGLRGMCYFKVEVIGSKSDLHSGIYGGTIIEPMIDLVHLLSSLVGPRAHMTIEGIYDDVAPITDTEWQLYTSVDFDLDSYQEEMGVWNLAIDDKVQVLMRQWRYPSLSIHGIEGAHWSPGEKAVIPRRVVGKFSIRTVPHMTSQKVFQCVTSHLKREFTHRKSPNKFKVAMTSSAECWLSDPARPHMKAAVSAMRHAYGMRPDLVRSGRTQSAAHLLCRHVCSDVVVMSIAPAGCGFESLNEHIRVDDLVAGAKLFAAYMYELSKLH